MLQVNSISFSYEQQLNIDNLSFELSKGKSMAIIGESGCGKSTLLKLIYGLYDLNQGQIFWNNNQVLGPKFHLVPGMDYMKYLAQDFDLMLFITVAENIGKYLSNTDFHKKKERISQLLDLVEMTDFANTKVKYLSGGQMQRTAIAKVLALEPEVLLLDEPFSHIDNFRKNSLRRKLFTYFKEHHITTIVATHDSTDVLSFTDEVIVLKNGKMVAQNSTEELYRNPSNYYVASLFSDVNQIEIDGKLELIYPNQLQIVKKSNIEVEIIRSYFQGTHYLIEAKFENQILFFKNEFSIDPKSKVCIKIKDL